MAGYYTNLSFAVEVDDPVAAAAEINRQYEIAQEEGCPEDPPEGWMFEEEPHGLSIEADEDGVWIHSEESASVEAAADIARWLLTQPGAPEVVGFEWASTCSKPRLDAFGGGGVIVTKAGARWMNTGDWLSREMHNGDLPAEVASLRESLATVQQAVDRASNDDEIRALSEALDIAIGIVNRSHNVDLPTIGAGS